MVQRQLTAAARPQAGEPAGAGADGDDVVMAAATRSELGPAPLPSPSLAGLAAAAAAVQSLRAAVEAMRFPAGGAAPRTPAAVDGRGMSIVTPALPSAIALARAVSDESGAPPTPAANADRLTLSGLTADDVDDVHAWLHHATAHAAGVSTDTFLRLLAALPTAPAPAMSQHTLARLGSVRETFIVRNGIPTFQVGVHYNSVKHCLDVSGWW
jgi:hypothetical protein